eukprot:TRINITY_DN12255_c0_g1_i2.p1 TRINITY_DN12255_c0_g1~~TRINITY_DN12255_c0_g1_i2.p1  ORF type:complete len:261 (-),score=33.25 TRINITY_DN12255_c0_g1_i2:430-1212(-)
MKFATGVTSGGGILLYCEKRTHNGSVEPIQQHIFNSLQLLYLTQLPFAFWKDSTWSLIFQCLWSYAHIFSLQHLFQYRWLSKQLTTKDFIFFHNKLSPEDVTQTTRELDHAFSSSSDFPQTNFGTFCSVEWSLRPDYTVPSGNKLPLPSGLAKVVDLLQNLVPEQQFNLVVVRKYETQQGIPMHKETLEMVGLMCLATFGDYKGGRLVFNTGKMGTDSPGQVLVIRANLPGCSRPVYEEETVTGGTKYSLIIATQRSLKI